MDITSYLLGKKSSGGGGGSGLDWTAIGYSGTPQSIIDGFNYAKSIYDNWDSSITAMDSMFTSNNTIMFMPLVDTSNVQYMTSTFANCMHLIYIPSLDTSNVKNVYSMFSSCNALDTIEKLDFSKMQKLNGFLDARSLTNLGGFQNLGMAYDTSKAENYSDYRLNLSYCNNLTHDSIMNVINNLYDIKTKGCNNQNLKLGATNIAKLTEEEIAIATNKGWNVTE